MGAIWEWALRSATELGASPFDIFLIIALIGCAIQHARLSAKYQLINTNFARACDEIHRLGGIKLIKQHRSGEYTGTNPLLDKE